MKPFNRLFAIAVLGVAVLFGNSQAQLGSGFVELGGARWLSSPEQAQQQAATQNKPLLVFEMLGRLDEKWC